MSLLKKASIITTPTAYAEDYLYSIKPAYALGSELVTNGDYSNGTTNWDATRNATLTASNNVLTVASDSSTYGGAARQVVTVVVGKKYKWEFTINEANDTRVGIRNGTADFGSGASILDINDLGVGTHTYTFKATATSVSIILGTMSLSGQEKYSNVSLKEITDADFDFDRNSTGTRVNEDYLIEDVPYNLNTYSEDFDQWTKINVTVSSDQILAPDGTLSADKLIATSGASNKVIFQGITAGTYTASVFAKKGEFEGLFIGTGTVGAFFNLNTYAYRTHYTSPPTSYQIESYGNGWYRYSITFTESSNNNLYIGPNDNVSTTLAITGDGSKGIYIWGAQLVKGDQPKDYLKTTDRLDIPRIDYTNGEPSILLEPSRTNSYTHNNNFTDSSWLQKDTSFGSTDVVSPDGLVNAKKLVCSDTTNQTHYFEKTTYTGTASTTYTYSIFVKSAGSDFVQVATSTGFGARYQNFNLAEGKKASGDLSAASYESDIVSYPNDWYRISVTATTTSGATSSRFILVPILTDAGRNPSFAGSTSKGVYIYGIQHEVGSYATSLIHTSGSTVTRSADVANNAGNSDLINSTEGVIYAEIKALADDGTNRRLSLSDGSDTNRINLMYTATNNQIVINYKVAGTTEVSLNKVFEDVTEFHKVAMRWESGNFAYYADGQEISTDSNTTMISANTLNTLRLEDPTGANDMYANVKSVMVFKEALTDLKLEKLTGYNNHELYMNYYNRLSYLGLAEEYNVESDINNYIL